MVSAVPTWSAVTPVGISPNSVRRISTSVPSRKPDSSPPGSVASQAKAELKTVLTAVAMPWPRSAAGAIRGAVAATGAVGTCAGVVCGPMAAAGEVAGAGSGAGVGRSDSAATGAVRRGPAVRPAGSGESDPRPRGPAIRRPSRPGRDFAVGRGESDSARADRPSRSAPDGRSAEPRCPDPGPVVGSVLGAGAGGSPATSAAATPAGPAREIPIATAAAPNFEQMLRRGSTPMPGSLGPTACSHSDCQPGTIGW